ncbi:hypothetical protein [Deinococcus marmoris]|uniref:Uncharacterized protein n=1 Tax=Deinococcus marmoris TaxID=249408 RepID=A0A1U7P317_9DEIO|nr:hypothetical protein [Deinococcus marmoris]OLV19548.1 hypothetical protein BOO71_0002383 [Deinococcus marmoris]
MTAPTRTELKAAADAFNAAQNDAALEPQYQQLRDAAAQGDYSRTVQIGAAQSSHFLAVCADGGLGVTDTDPGNPDLKTYLVSWA